VFDEEELLVDEPVAAEQTAQAFTRNENRRMELFFILKGLLGNGRRAWDVWIGSPIAATPAAARCQQEGASLEQMLYTQRQCRDIALIRETNG